MISIIVPVYNEVEVLPLFIKNFFENIALNEKYELIFVNDGSKDRTKYLIKESMKKHKEIKLVSYDVNKGLGHALRMGFNSSRGRIMVTMDSDLAHPPYFIPKLVEKVDEGYDVVIGSRYMPTAGIKGVPFHKDFLSKLTNRVTNFIIHSNIRDLTSGFRAFNSVLLKKINTKEIGFGVELEILIKLMKKKAKIAEIPFTAVDRQAGKSKFSVLRQGIGYIIRLLKILSYR